MAYVPPRRTTSTASTVAVESAQTIDWIPAVGTFNSIRRADTGTVMIANEIDPDYFMEDGSPQVYANRPFAGIQGAGFWSVWNSQAGAAYNPDLGEHGSILLMGGGHFTYNGCAVPRFDIASGIWSWAYYPPYMSIEKEVTGGTVATLTGVVSSYDAYVAASYVDHNDRVNKAGNYTKYMDSTPIPGSGDDIYGTNMTVINPYPVHTNCGIIGLPAAGGGGPQGSLLMAGHYQTGISAGGIYSQIFKLDCDTSEWSALLIGDLGSSSYSFPGMEYDSNRGLVWYFPVDQKRPIIVDYKQNPPARHQLTNPAINFSNAIAGVTYMPSRDLMVYIIGTNVGAPAPNGAWNMYPLVKAIKLNGYQFGVTSTLPQFNLIINGSPNNLAYMTKISQGIHPDWPGYRTGSQLNTGEVSWLGGSDKGNFFDKSWGPSYTNGVLNTSKYRLINDRLEYCEYEDCLFYLERQRGWEDQKDIPKASRTSQTEIVLWKLMPPPIGQEETGSWDWVREPLIRNPVYNDPGAISTYYEAPSWGGKVKYIPALKCAYYTDKPDLPVQAFRSADWI